MSSWIEILPMQRNSSYFNLPCWLVTGIRNRNVMIGTWTLTIVEPYSSLLPSLSPTSSYYDSWKYLHHSSIWRINLRWNSCLHAYVIGRVWEVSKCIFLMALKEKDTALVTREKQIREKCVYDMSIKYNSIYSWKLG